ncbi:response regulator transcription factor [Alienimonas californiensis]|uniref:Response regulator protein TodT n=1 Tax=Alienimonas californiensis TaxID=2527989 RepID=A0A517P5P2_9PLAN|nr:response regulator [Alienimonas californiensis]QDT14692.1 Response regulator protein TodT [Alienimonas californiensis]
MTNPGDAPRSDAALDDPPPGPPALGDLASAPTVHIVDDDEEMRDSLRWLIESVGMRAVCYGSGAEFLQRQREGRGAAGDGPGCLVSDVRMPRMSGLDMYEAFKADGGDLPVIFITAHADVPMAVRALQSGAAEFLEKPFNRHALLERVQRAVRRDARRRDQERALTTLDRRFAALSDRERLVLEGLKRGLPNREIAEQAQVTVRAVEMRRSGLMKKLGAPTLADLLRLAWCVETRTPPDAGPEPSPC